jgi:hypothetical protein
MPVSAAPLYWNSSLRDILLGDILLVFIEHLLFVSIMGKRSSRLISLRIAPPYPLASRPKSLAYRSDCGYAPVFSAKILQIFPVWLLMLQ